MNVYLHSECVECSNVFLPRGRRDEPPEGAAQFNDWDIFKETLHGLDDALLLRLGLDVLSEAAESRVQSHSPDRCN